MSKTQITRIRLLEALWALDERRGGYMTREAADTVLAYFSARLPSLKLEESGDLFRIYDPLSEQYFWPEQPDLKVLDKTADKLVADIIAATGRQPTYLPTFEFSITRAVTESARVRVTAATIEQAQSIALQPAFFADPEKARFKVDEGQEARVPFLTYGDEHVIARGDGWDAIDSVTGKDVPVLGMEERDEDPSP